MNAFLLEVAAGVCEFGECVQVSVCVCTSDETESTTYVQVNTYARKLS